MLRIMGVIAGCALAVSGVAAPKSAKVRFTVRLIRAADTTQALPSGSTPVGSELAGVLHGPLKWHHYWRICERKVEVGPGEVKRVALLNSREVEIDLTVQNRRLVTAFENGRFLGRTAVPVGDGLSLIGGSRDKDSGWFIVVARD